MTFEQWQVEQRDVALQHWRRAVKEIRASGGSVHPNIRESAIEFGLFAGVSAEQIKRELCAVGCFERNIENALRVTLANNRSMAAVAENQRI